MNLGDVMEELAEAAKTAVPRSFAYPPDKVSPPAFLVSLPDSINPHGTYGRGMTEFQLPGLLLVGKAQDRASVKQLVSYMSGSGGSSIVAALEGAEYTKCDVVTVANIEFQVITMAAVDYLGAELTINITGSGA